jgi:hypothetical protein
MRKVVLGILQDDAKNILSYYYHESDVSTSGSHGHLSADGTTLDTILSLIHQNHSDISTIFILHDASSSGNQTGWIDDFVTTIQTIRRDLKPILIIIGTEDNNAKPLHENVTISYITPTKANTAQYRRELLESIVYKEMESIKSQLQSMKSKPLLSQWTEYMGNIYTHTSKSAFNTNPVNQTTDDEVQPNSADITNNNISMKFLGGVIAALGITALVIALIALALHAQSLAIVVGATGVVTTLVGVGIFARAHYQDLEYHANSNNP